MKKSALILGILMIIFGCGKQSTDKKVELAKLKKDKEKLEAQIAKLEKELGDPENPNSKVKYVSVKDIKPQEFNHYIEVQGKVDGDENVGVSPKAPGVVTKIYVKQGEAVKKDQILAQLDDEVIKKGLKEVSTALDFATQMYEKQKNLWDKKIGSEVQYLAAKNNKESLENKMATLKDQMDQMKIKSPINGTVEDLPIKIGQAVSPGMPAMRVVNFSDVKVIAEVTEAYASKIKTGNDVIINFPDLNKEIKAKVSFSSKYINPVNRTFNVEIKLNPKEIDARANMIAVIKINDYKAESAIVVPVNLIQNSLDGQFVFVAKEEGGKEIVRKQNVKQGMTYNGMAEIKSGLKEGDKVISVGYLDLNEGQLLSINN